MGARTWGAAIGATVGFVLVVVLATLTGTVFYAANGQEHAIGPAFWAGSVLFIGTQAD